MIIHIIEDDDTLRGYILKYLRNNNLKAVAYKNGEEFFKDLDISPDDCIIVDINLPQKSGFEIIESLNGMGLNLRIIFISASKDIKNIENAFYLGAKDYIKKPFELKELILRINNLYETKKECFKKDIPICGNIVYKTEYDLVYDGDDLLELSKVQLKLLNYFLINKNRPLSYENIIETVWVNDPVSKTTLSSHINTLRGKLPCLDIINIRSFGYKLKI